MLYGPARGAAAVAAVLVFTLSGVHPARASDGLPAIRATTPAAEAAALSITLHSGGIGSLSWSLGHDPQLGLDVIDIHTTWATSERSFLRFENLPLRTNFMIRLHLLNASGNTWSCLTNELLDPAGQTEDVLDAPPPYWVPVGWTTSNDIDGLSFAQAASVLRGSSAFPNFLVDEASDRRDFIEFFNGLVAAGQGVDTITYGIRDSGVWNNQPFLLALLPCIGDVVPAETSTWGGVKRRFR